MSCYFRAKGVPTLPLREGATRRTLTIAIVMTPDVHELVGGQLLQLARLRIPVLAHKVLCLLQMYLAVGRLLHCVRFSKGWISSNREEKNGCMPAALRCRKSSASAIKRTGEWVTSRVDAEGDERGEAEELKVLLEQHRNITQNRLTRSGGDPTGSTGRFLWSV